MATGEHWYGKQALDLGLVDEIATSDDVVLSLAKEHQIFKLKYQMRKKLADKIAHGASLSVSSVVNKLAEFNRVL